MLGAAPMSACFAACVKRLRTALPVLESFVKYRVFRAFAWALPCPYQEPCMCETRKTLCTIPNCLSRRNVWARSGQQSFCIRCPSGKPSTRIWLVARCCVGAYHGLVMSVPSPPAPQSSHLELHMLHICEGDHMNSTNVCLPGQTSHWFVCDAWSKKLSLMVGWWAQCIAKHRVCSESPHFTAQELSLSHDRCLLSRVDGDGRQRLEGHATSFVIRSPHDRIRCVCYSCDNTRPEFSLSKPVAEEAHSHLRSVCTHELVPTWQKVSTCVWQHIPAETQAGCMPNCLRVNRALAQCVSATCFLEQHLVPWCLGDQIQV